MITIRDTQERALNGKVVDERDYDMKVLPARLRELVKEYDIKYNPEQLIPSDASLCKDVFDAALDLVEDLGLYCPDTGRTVTFTREEVMETLGALPKSITVGEGLDTRTVTLRKPEDKKPLIHMVGAHGTVVTEELYILTQQAFAQSGGDILQCANLKSVGGWEAKAGFPSEIMAGLAEGRYSREAARRAGRPGMAIEGVHSVCTPQATYAAIHPAGFRPGVDIVYTAYPQEMRLLMKHLQRSLWCRQFGISEWVRHGSIFGAYTGPIEAATVCAVAAGLGAVVAGNYNVLVDSVISREGNVTRPETIWGAMLVSQTIKRMTDLITWAGGTSVSGACTETCLWEICSTMVPNTICGGEIVMDAYTRGGYVDDCETPLEFKFGREVANATVASGMKLSDANEFVKKVVPKYIDKINPKEHTPRGKTFPECYDLKTLTPSEEWLGIYKKVKAELADMGYFSFE